MDAAELKTAILAKLARRPRGYTLEGLRHGTVDHDRLGDMALALADLIAAGRVELVTYTADTTYRLN